MEILTEGLFHIFAFAVILTVIVFVHEFGHYLAAKLSGVKVTDFSIGFGKKFFAIKDKSGTEWKFCWIPLGGYVKFFGDDNVASMSSKGVKSKLSKQEAKESFEAKSLPVKAIIAFAGPFANLLLAVAIFTFFFFAYGKMVSDNTVTVVQDGSVAHFAGIKAGDKITAVDGSTTEEFKDIELYVSSHPNIALKLTVERDQEIFIVPITPEPKTIKDIGGNDVVIGRLGIGSTNISHKTYGFLDSVGLAVSETIKVSQLTFKAIGQIISGTRDTKDIGSVIKISKYSAMHMKQGFLSTLWFIVFISINLGLVNLLPIPPLDGGHLLIYAVEGICGKKIATYFQKYASRVGLVMLIALMIFAVANDIIHL